MPAPAEISDAGARELAREILARPEYAQHRRDPTFVQRWIDGLSAWLDEQADRVAGWIPDWATAAWDGFWDGLRGLLTGVFGEDAAVVVMRVAIAAFVLGAFGILAHRVLREMRARGEEERAEVELGSASGPRLIDEARSFADAGRWLEAAHCVQLAALQLLLDKRCLELDRSDPNRTLRRRLQDAPLPDALRERFLQLLDRLEGAWFRDRTESAGLYRDWHGLYTRIHSLPEQR